MAANKSSTTAGSEEVKRKTSSVSLDGAKVPPGMKKKSNKDAWTTNHFIALVISAIVTGFIAWEIVYRGVPSKTLDGDF